VAMVDQAIRAALRDHAGTITGLSNLADGADHIFARAVLDAGGTLEAFIPARKFRAGLPLEAQAEFDDLLAHASTVHNLPYTESNSEAHMAASKAMIDSADELFAVWDGQSARAFGGTADAVAYARELKIPIRLIWPPGSRRE
jgi:hypothetical protein